MAVGKLLFQIASDTFALPLEAVVEVTGGGVPHLIPLVPREVGGILNVRGEPIPALDAGVLLRGRPSGASRHLVVLAWGSGRLGVLVEHVARIDRELGDGVVDEDHPTAWGGVPLRFAESASGRVAIVDPEGLLARAAELLAARPKLSGDGEGSCPTAF